jgi:hypothetical protein
MKLFSRILISTLLILTSRIILAGDDPYTVELEQISIPGSPLIHSFAFAQSDGKWLFIGGRINGLHGFTALNSFPKQYSNVNIYVVDPATNQTWSRNIFLDLPLSTADQLRSANMQSTQIGNKLYLTGGYGYDSTSNGLITYPILKVIDVSEIINAVTSGASVSPFIRQFTDSRLQVAGGELHKLGDYFYLIGGHKFTGTYRRNVNNQVYSNQIKKFKVIDNGVSISIADYSALTDTVEYHRRDMNVVSAVKPDGVTPYMILYGGVFKYNRDLPYLNPIYIDENGVTLDYSFEQKMSQYTCSNMTLFNLSSQKMHTTFFGGTSLYYYNENSNSLVYDSLVPFIKDITTLTRSANGSSEEKVLNLKFPELLGTNAKFILNESIPHFENDVIKLDQLTGRTFAGYIFGGIKAQLPNNGESSASEYIFKVYVTPDIPLPVELASFTSSVNKRNVYLSWSTSSENNNSGFEIERKSLNNSEVLQWINAGSVRGYGNSNSTKTYFYEDRGLTSGKYIYRLKQIDFNGNYKYYELSGEAVIGIPEKFYLSQNYPNPFNPVTKIDFEIPTDGNVSIKIYDNKGSEVKTLIDEFRNSGYYSVLFSGDELSSGVYFYKIESNKFKDTKKMFLVK